MRSVLLTAAAGLVLLSAGCTSSRSASPTPVTGSPSASSSTLPSTAAPPTTPAPAPPPSYGAVVADRAEVHPGTIAVSGSGKVVAESLVRYMRVRMTAYRRAELDTGALAQVARGPALEDVRSYVARLKQQGRHTVGAVWVDVSRVDMQGTRATISSCMSNATADVDVHDRVVERDISPAYLVAATAVRGGPAGSARWLIDSIRFDGRPSCSAR